MALMGERVVEEWLNRKGYFTIRGIKIGVHEIDLLAFKPNVTGQHDCRHIEVQLSTNPVAYITKVPKDVQKKKGIGPDNAKERTITELSVGIQEWIDKKYEHPKKIKQRKILYPGTWSKELVVNVVKHPLELDIFRKKGITIHYLKDIVKEINGVGNVVKAAGGADILDLINLGGELS
jgi:hypothetical protein